MRKILYITYDGLTDPLGQSQIIPYLQGLSKHGYKFFILSFEKKDRFLKNEHVIRKLLEPYSIEWVPLSFTTKPPLFSKLYDVLRMQKTAQQLHEKNHFDMVHCRGYLTADVGLRLKKKFGIKFFFDMRGFWADEKKDGGAWDMKNPLFKRVYRYYKNKEAQYLKYADYIISLTDAGKAEMENWTTYNNKIPVTVIPCCADMEHFSLTDADQRKQSRAILRIDNDVLVVSYLGSVGAWYMLDEMFELFSCIKKKYPDAFFLFVSHSDPVNITDAAKRHAVSAQDLLVVEASRQQVPVFIKASDINISFIKPVFSKISSSPTKLGEVLSMGIPVIANAGVGDVENIINKTKAGVVLHQFNQKEYEVIVNSIQWLLKMKPSDIRENAAEVYDLQTGVSKYLYTYKYLFPGK